MFDEKANQNQASADAERSLSAFSRSANDVIDLCGYSFAFIQELEPEKDASGNIKVFDPKVKYSRKDTVPLNSHGSGPFCKFSIHSDLFGGVCGVYALFDSKSLLYVGMTRNFAQRFDQGYGIISPKNCYVGGQSTNCKINTMVLDKYLTNEHVYLFFHKTSDYRHVEAELIQTLSPPYNESNIPGYHAVKKADIYTNQQKTGGEHMNNDNSFEPIWQSILAHAGETFYISKGPFTYTAHGSYIVSSRAASAKLSRGNFEKAYQSMNLLAPSEFSRKIIGSSYVKAILTDSRIISE